jgi:hypothetical protein
LDFIDAEKWEKLITTHLKQLRKFIFHITCWEISIDDINLAAFNTDFWHQLHVYVACDWFKGSFEEDGDIAHVYTVPFCRSFFLTTPSMVNVITPSMNSSYESIRILKIIMDEKLFRGTKYKYVNVDSIILDSSVQHNNDILLFLNLSVNCNNIHYLGFTSVCGILKPQVFCQLLQQCPNLYSLRLHSEILDQMTNKFTNENTCLLLRKMIKHAQFNSGSVQEDFAEETTKRFAQTFNNLERLFVHMKSPDDILKKLLIMIPDMIKLNKIFIKTNATIPDKFIDQIRQSIVALKDCYIRKEKMCLFIWR